jgi:hypothetical protein
MKICSSFHFHFVVGEDLVFFLLDFNIVLLLSEGRVLQHYIKPLEA